MKTNSTIRNLILFAIFTTWTCPFAGAQQDRQPSVAKSKINMVATVNPQATQAGLDAMENGGNAIDAAIAAALTLGVVDGFNSGIGGGCFILIRTADGETIAIDGREMAPAAAHRDMYLVDGKPETKLSQVGPLAVGVPGALKAYHQATELFGNLKFKQLILPASKIAEEGFVVSRTYANRLKSAEKEINRFPGSAEVLTHGGKAYQKGELLKQPDLARTYEMIGNQGISYFYEGEFAKTVGDWMDANGGILTAEDFANYKTIQRKPIESTYRDLKIYGFPPPSSGGVHVAQILNMLENFDLKEIYDQNPAQFTHVVAEAMKLAFADRAHWLGDPDFVNVPKGLLDQKYADELAARIDLKKATKVDSHGKPPKWDSEFFEKKHTTHVAAADREGNWVAITTTVNTTFGSKVIVPGTGVVLNNQMDDFSIAPGTPNAFGLIGSEANAVAAGKRPLSSMSPTIVVRDDRPVMTVGAAGGPRIITQAVLAIIRHHDLELEIGDAINKPRFHHQWVPNRLSIEAGTDDSIVTQLESMGHTIKVTSTAGTSQAIVWDESTGTFYGVADPRVEGMAIGK